jgi:catechol 2,3-dioxygenase-like lactoylglutathione lyase family enzyme
MITKAIPQLPSLNLRRSKQFYEVKLGFELKHQYTDLIILAKDEVELHLWLCSDPSLPRSSSAYFQITSIEDFYEHCERQGVVHPNAHLQDKPWGMKVFYSVDPDENQLKFGELSFK